MIKIKNWNKNENAIEYIRFEDNKSVVLQKEDIFLLIEKNRQNSNALNDKEMTNILENKEISNINNNKEVKKSNSIDSGNSSISTNTDKSNLTNNIKPKLSLADMIEKFCNERDKKAELNKEQNVEITTKGKSFER